MYSGELMLFFIQMDVSNLFIELFLLRQKMDSWQPWKRFLRNDNIAWNAESLKLVFRFVEKMSTRLQRSTLLLKLSSIGRPSRLLGPSSLSPHHLDLAVENTFLVWLSILGFTRSEIQSQLVVQDQVNLVGARFTPLCLIQVSMYPLKVDINLFPLSKIWTQSQQGFGAP